MNRLVVALVCLFLAQTAQAEGVIRACKFPTLPDMVLQEPADTASAKTMMTVGARPPAEVASEPGATDNFESAEIDGFRFRFSTIALKLDVEKDGKTLISEVGQCVVINGPVAEVPLSIATPAGVSSETDSNATNPTEPPADSKQTAPPDDTGKWRINKDKSQIDDSESVYLSLNSNALIPGQFGGSGPAMLWLRCLESTTAVLLQVNDLFLTDIEGYGSVTYRVDDRKAIKIRMVASTDNKSLGLWSGGSAIPFIKNLMKGEHVVFRVTPFNESPVEFEMDLSGITAAVDPLRKACKW